MKTHCLRAAQSADSPYSFTLSTEAVDSYETIIRSDGWDLKRFLQNPIALFNHSHDNIVGQWNNVKVKNKSLTADFVPAEKGTSALVDTVRALIEQRILRASSVGFVPKKSVYDQKREVVIFTEAELVEVSLVSVPANSEALALARKFGASAEETSVLFNNSGESVGKIQVMRKQIELAKLRRHY